MVKVKSKTHLKLNIFMGYFFLVHSAISKFIDVKLEFHIFSVLLSLKCIIDLFIHKRRRTCTKQCTLRSTLNCLECFDPIKFISILDMLYIRNYFLFFETFFLYFVLLQI